MQDYQALLHENAVLRDEIEELKLKLGHSITYKKGKLDDKEKQAVEEFLSRVEKREIRIARGELAKEMRVFVCPHRERSLEFFEKLGMFIFISWAIMNFHRDYGPICRNTLDMDCTRYCSITTWHASLSIVTAAPQLQL